MKAGLTHCGFGGVLEFITAGVPIVALPHFDDQHDNAEMLAKRKAAVILHNEKRESKESIKVLSYYDPVFDANKVYEVFNEILTNEVYAHNIKKLQTFQKKTGGRNLAVQVIEDAHEIGFDHLVDKAHIEKWNSLNACTCCLFWTFTIGIISALIAFTVLYFLPSEGEAPVVAKLL